MWWVGRQCQRLSCNGRSIADSLTLGQVCPPFEIHRVQPILPAAWWRTSSPSESKPKRWLSLRLRLVEFVLTRSRGSGYR
jgi:hypothetical protein